MSFIQAMGPFVCLFNGISNDGDTIFSRILIDSPTLSQEFCELIG